jgi:hypothetical protein
MHLFHISQDNNTGESRKMAREHHEERGTSNLQS